MGNIETFVTRMRYWCEEANLGYDQGQRNNIVVGGECDCSSLVIHAAKEAGFNTGWATYTGNMRAAFSANGWSVLSPSVAKQAGDILLADAHHVAVYVGNGLLAQASIDERGQIAGGQSGDQTNYETNVRSYYNYPWSCVLRATGAGTSAYNPNGYDHEYVHSVQRLLISLGYDVGPSWATGVLDSITYNTIKRFQKNEGLTVDGVPGPNTIYRLRTKVVTEGYLEVDGFWGAATGARFREVFGLPSTVSWVRACQAFQRFLNKSIDPRHIANLTGYSQLEVDGIDGEKTWTCFQWWLNNYHSGICYKVGGVAIDGVYGPQTVKGVQGVLNISHANSGKLG